MGSVGCPILIIYDLNYEVKGTFSADLCQGQLFSNLAILDSHKNVHCVTSYGQIQRFVSQFVSQPATVFFFIPCLHVMVYLILVNKSIYL